MSKWWDHTEAWQQIQKMIRRNTQLFRTHYKQHCSVENTNEQVVGSHRSLATNTKSMIRRNALLFRRYTSNAAQWRTLMSKWWDHTEAWQEIQKNDQKKYTTFQKKYKQYCVENTNEQVVGSHRSLATQSHYSSTPPYASILGTSN